MADLAHRAVAVVSVNVEKDRHAARTISFERKFLVNGAWQFAGTALDGSLDIIGGHVLGFGGQNGSPQSRIGVGITASVLGCNADFLDKTGEYLAALGIK